MRPRSLLLGHVDRVVRFRLWRSLVAMNPKRFRIKFYWSGPRLIPVLQEYQYGHRHLTSPVGYGVLSQSNPARWDWHIIGELPAWTIQGEGA